MVYRSSRRRREDSPVDGESVLLVVEDFRGHEGHGAAEGGGGAVTDSLVRGGGGAWGRGETFLHIPKSASLT